MLATRSQLSVRCEFGSILKRHIQGRQLPAAQRLLRNSRPQYHFSVISSRGYANGRPHPPGGTHRMDLGGGEKQSPLEQFSVDLTARAKQGKLDPVIGRDAEIHRTIQVLSRRTKNNPGE